MVYKLKKKSGGSSGHSGGSSFSGIDPSSKVRLVTSNQERREAWVRGELSHVKPKVTLPRFSWDKEKENADG